jgi:AcrR family transcriptional regulator
MTEHADRDTRREQILDAARKMFVSQGYENSSVDDIARAAGLSKGSIYWYFRSKLEILLALADQCMDEHRNEVVRLAEMDQYGPEALYKSHRHLIEGKLTTPEHDQLFGQLVEMSKQHPEIEARLKDYYHAWDTTVSTLLQRGMDEGLFRHENALLITQAITSLYDGAFQRAKIDTDLDIVGVIETATRLMYEALKADLKNPSSTESQ